MESLSSKQRRVALPYPQHQHQHQQQLGGAEASEQRRASRRKRPRRQLQPQQHRTAADEEDTAASCRQCMQGPEQVVDALCEYDVCLYVRWHSPEGGTKVKRLPLDPIASVDDLRGLFRRLIQGAFSGSPLPDYLTCPDFYKFSPAQEDCICLPGDMARTHFRLVVTLGGWEYGVVDRELGVAPDPARNLLVTVAEFESDVFELDGQECVMNLISYPTICVRRDFLDAAVRELQRSRAADAGSGEEDTQGAPAPAPSPGAGAATGPALGPPMPASSTSA